MSEDLGWLRGRASEGRAAVRADADRLAALTYRFVTAIEGCRNVAQHLCASEGWGPPATNAEALRPFGRHQVLEAARRGMARRYAA